MATGQSLLDRMELLDQELQLQAGENDVTRGLLALNVAQDYFESLLASYPKMSGDNTATVVTAASTETTAFPTGCLRIDRIQWIDPATSRPSGPDLVNLGYVGSHVSTFPTFLNVTNGTGRPRGYWTQGRSIYWSPLPNAVHTLRWYGLASASDLTAGGTFAYPDFTMLPLAAFAVRLLHMGVGDDPTALVGLAGDLFTPTIEAMKAVGRSDRPPGYDYTMFHTE